MATKNSLKAAAATSGMFAKAPEQETPKRTRKPKAAAAPETTPDPKRETVTFSVKIDSDTLKKWRIYTSMNGYGDKGKLTETALNEYMNRHKLTPEQQAKFDTLYEL